jgi:hypothetical protein
MHRLARLSTIISGTSAFIAVAFTGCDPKPSITVEPGAGLQDGQTVVVTLKGFPPRSTITVRQCPVGADPNACGADGVPVKTDHDGRARVELTVRQLLPYWHESQSYWATCSYRGYCAISASGVPAADWAPLHFQDEIVPITTANPTTGLNGLHALVRVTGSNLPPGAHVRFLQCLAGADEASGCQLITGLIGDGYSDVLTLGEQFLKGNCDAPGKCELRTIVNGVYEVGRVPLSFESGATSHVTPTTDLRDQQEVTARGIHIPNGARVDFLQCLSADAAAACEDLGRLGPVTDGSYAEALNVRRNLAAGSCEPPARCEIRVRIGTDQLGAHALSFVPAPRIRVEPSTQLNAIHRVAVSGKTSSYPSVDIYQCVVGQTETCRRVGEAAADDTGSFALSVEVQQTYRDGVCDAPGKCELRLYNSGAHQASAPISFNPVGALALGTIEPFGSVTAGEPLPIAGRDWSANTAVRVGVIPAANPSFGGGNPLALGYRIADASGSFSDAPALRGFLARVIAPVWFPFGGGDLIGLSDCVSTSGSCVLVAHDFRASTPSVRVPLAVQQPAIATGSASIEQSMPLPYNAHLANPVVIRGSGWAPNRTLEVYQCASHLHLCVGMPAITADAAGSFRVQSNVYYGAGTSSPESGLNFTCHTPTFCVVVVADSRAGLDAAARIPMYIASTAE